MTDEESYKNLLKKIGMTEEQVQVEVHRDDVKYMSLPDVHLNVSPIHGLGLFASRNFDAGETICPARIGEFRTVAGRYINHAHIPNTKPVIVKDMFMVVAVSTIEKGQEITLDYEEVMRVNKQGE